MTAGWSEASQVLEGNQTGKELSRGEKNFISQYIRIVNSKDEQKYRQLFYPSVHKCMTAGDQDFIRDIISYGLEDRLDSNAKISIIPISAEEFRQRREVLKGQDISFPVMPTHQLKIITSSRIKAVEKNLSEKSEIKEDSTQVIVKVFDLVEEDGKVYIISACPSKALRASKNKPSPVIVDIGHGGNTIGFSELAAEIKTGEKVVNEKRTETVIENRTSDLQGHLLSFEKYKKDKLGMNILIQYQEYDISGALLSDSYYGENGGEGYYKTYYRSGQVRSEVPIVNRRWQGQEKYYHPDGSLEKTINYQNGYPEGWKPFGIPSPIPQPGSES